MMSEGYICELVRMDGTVCESGESVMVESLSLCSSVVRASHQRSEGYRFDSHQGLRTFF